MARYILFLITLSWLLVGCAEVLPLTGGATDITAPRPVLNSQVPEQGETNFSGSKVTVEFDEYIVMNDPANTASMNPAAGKLTVTNNKRKVSIAWDQPLQPNTTYIIQLNGTVQDLNEKNDTIHQFVFSTGNTIDTLQVIGKINSAFTDAPAENYTVGLYPVESNPMTSEAVYLTRTNKQGKFTFAYLKEENYRLFAYQDANKDRRYTMGEPYAFLNESVSTKDSLVPRLSSFTERNALNKLQVNLQFPGLAVAFGRKLNTDSLLINGQNAVVLKKIRDDSMVVALPPYSGTSLNFTYHSDTVSKLISEKDRKQPIQLICTDYKKFIRSNDTIHFEVNDIISQVDKQHILLLDSKNQPIGFTINNSKNAISIVPESIATDKFMVTFLPNAVKSAHVSNDTIRVLMEYKRAADLSNLTINCSALSGENWLIQLMDGKTVVASNYKSSSDSLVVFSQLLPGTYQIRCIQDTNRNGLWDAGSYALLQQAEVVYRFELKSKLRANWDIEETLELNINE